MKVLITGATGFVGTRLAALSGARRHVRGLVRDVDRARTCAPRAWSSCRATCPTRVAAARRAGGGVYLPHGRAGGRLAGPRGHAGQRRGDAQLVSRPRRGVRRVVHFSSLAVYGNRHHRGTDESAPYRYGDTYTDAKIDSERAILDLARGRDRGRVPAAGFVYGPGDRTLLPKLLEALRGGSSCSLATAASR